MEPPRIRVRWLISATALTSLGQGYLIVYVTAHLPDLGFTAGAIGLLYGVFGIVPVLTGIPLGLYSDRRGRKTLLLLGTAGVPPGLLGFAVSTDLAWLVAAVVVLGLAEAAFLTSWNAIMADLTSKDERDAVFSFAFIVNIACIGIGASVPLFFPWIEAAWGTETNLLHQEVMGFFAALSALTPILLSVLLRRYTPDRTPKEEGGSRKGSLGLLLRFSGINSLGGLGAGLIVPLVPTWFYLRFGIGDTYTGPLLTVAGITVAFAASASPWLARRLGAVRAIAAAEGLSAAFLFSMALVLSPVVAAGFFLARAALVNLANPLADSYLMGIVDREQRGLASALNTIIFQLPNSGSTILGGLLLAAGLYGLPFFLAGALYAISVAALYVVFRNVKPHV